MTVETFEQVLNRAQAAGGLNPAWKKFLKTKFVVPVDRAGTDPRKYTLHVAPGLDGAPCALTISEEASRLDQRQGNGTASLYGADIVRKVQTDAEILVALSDRAFKIALDKVDWLKKGVAAAQARAAALKPQGGFDDGRDTQMHTQEPSTTLMAPQTIIPAPPLPSARAPAPAPRVAGPLDVAALKPRSVGTPAIGLSFFVPGAWVEKRNTRSTFYTDLALGTKVEVSGALRPNVSLGQFMTTRLAQVGHDLPYLKQVGDSYPIEGEDWGGRIRGMATEFAGVFPGEQRESRYMVACIWTEGTVMSMSIRAYADDFEYQRALYKWMLGRVDLAPAMAPAAAATGHAEEGDTATPKLYGWSLEGRIGRLRGLAYSLGVVPFVAVPLLLAIAVPKNMGLAFVGITLAGAFALWFSLRLMVMRMHDLDVSGKWVLGLFALMGLAGASRDVELVGIASALFWLVSIVTFYFLPGTRGYNRYGPPPGPDSTLVKLCAGLLLAVQLVAIVATYKAVRSGTYPYGVERAGSAAQAEGKVAADVRAVSGAATPFSPPDKSFTVMLPGTPAEVPMPPEIRAQLGEVRVHHYQLESGGRAYIVQSINFISSAPDNFALMDKLQAAAVGRDGTLATTRPMGFNGYTGREVVVDLPDGGIRVARFVVFGSRVANVVVGAPAGKTERAAIDATLNTFELR